MTKTLCKCISLWNSYNALSLRLEKRKTNVLWITFSRGVFGTVSNIYDGAFSMEIEIQIIRSTSWHNSQDVEQTFISSNVK